MSHLQNLVTLAMLTLAGALLNAAPGHAQNGPIKIKESPAEYSVSDESPFDDVMR